MVIPRGLEKIQSKLKFTSAKLIPPFDPNLSGCTDNTIYGPSLDIVSDYHTKITNSDYLLYVGVVNEPDEPYLAYGTFCVKGFYEKVPI